MMFNTGDRIIGKRYEFKDKKGTVIQQYNETIVLVKFDGVPITVATITDNLEILQEKCD